MGRRERVDNPTKKHYILEGLLAVLVAIIISLALILIMALIIRLANVGEGALPIITQVIKGVSILVACLVFLRHPKNYWLRGMLVGLAYIVIAFILFSLLNGATFRFGLNILTDVAIGTVTGLISGVIASLIRKRK